MRGDTLFITVFHQIDGSPDPAQLVCYSGYMYYEEIRIAYMVSSVYVIFLSKDCTHFLLLPLCESKKHGGLDDVFTHLVVSMSKISMGTNDSNSRNNSKSISKTKQLTRYFSI